MCDIREEVLPLVIYEEVNIVVYVDRKTVDGDEVLEVEHLVVFGGDEQEVENCGEGNQREQEVVDIENYLFEVGLPPRVF